MKYSVTYAGVLDHPNTPERVALNAIMPRLGLQEVHLPGEMFIHWKKSDLRDRPDELAAALNWTGSDVTASVRIARSELFDIDQFDSIRRAFNLALSKFYMIHAQQRLRDFDALMEAPAETAVAS